MFLNPSLKRTGASTSISFAIVVLLVSLLGGCSSKSSPSKQPTVSIPAGWYLSLYNTSVDLIKAEENKPAYKLSFDRTNELKDAKHYLRIAESIFPHKSKVLTGQSKDTENWYFERIWWNETFRKTPIPFSLTADTINHYIDRYKSQKQKLKQRVSQNDWKGSNLDRVELLYSAKVIKEGTINLDGKALPKIRVRMKFRWYEYCGQPCGWGFEKSRDVVFAGKYKVVSITGDGPVRKWVSTEAQPYGPDQWIKF